MVVEVISRAELVAVAEVIGEASAAQKALNASLIMRDPVFLRDKGTHDLFVVDGYAKAREVIAALRGKAKAKEARGA